jgi:cytochrome c-type biogenesis protein CcmF
LTAVAFGRIGFAQSLRRLFGLPRTAWATAIAHFGLGVTVIGIVAASAWEVELVTTMRPGDTKSLAGYAVTFDGLTQQRGPNYVAERGNFTIVSASGESSVAHPERRVYDASRMPTTEAAIQTHGFSQLYLQLGEPGDVGQVVRIWYKPYVTLIWLGAVLMALAGLLSLSYRRLRVGAPKPAANRVAAAE